MGGLRFDAVLGGNAFTCGVTTTGQGYCWGQNFAGKLGDGTETDRTTPTPIATPN
jgi:alpha-tubulin suppressor-like RCC1 family protein